MSEEKKFVDGMIVKLPPDTAPDFVKLKLSFKLDEFGSWIGAQKAEDPSLEWINVEIASTKLTCVLGSDPNFVEDDEKSFEFEVTCA